VVSALGIDERMHAESAGALAATLEHDGTVVETVSCVRSAAARRSVIIGTSTES